MKKNTLILLFVSLILHVEASYAKDEYYSGPDFTAKKVIVDSDGKMVSQIHMGKQGFREILMTNVPFEIIYISNYKKKKVWMVVPSKKLYSDMASMPGYKQSELFRGTMFDDSPCIGFSKTKKFATRNINKQKIEEWGCVDKKSKKAILQWFNPKTKMVVREKDKGMGDSDITVSYVEFKNQPDNLFVLPSGYKEVSMREMQSMMYK